MRFNALNVRQLLDNVKTWGYIYVRELADNGPEQKSTFHRITQIPPDLVVNL